MSFNFKNLDKRTRELMLEEVELDLKNEELYLSKRFSGAGRLVYPQLLKKAVTSGNEEILEEDLRKNNCFEQTETARNRSGLMTIKKVRLDAPTILAEGEFNRFYIRALCRRLLEEGGGELVIYRAKNVKIPRPESQIRIGKSVSAEQLLEDLRRNKDVDTALGVPAGPNSGLSVMIQ